MNPELIIKDYHAIQSLVIDSSQRIANVRLEVHVGRNDVTRIEAYNEFAGEGDYGLWFAIYAGERIIRRVNGRYVVEVGYGQA